MRARECDEGYLQHGSPALQFLFRSDGCQNLQQGNDEIVIRGNQWNPRAIVQDKTTGTLSVRFQQCCGCTSIHHQLRSQSVKPDEKHSMEDISAHRLLDIVT